MPYFSTQSTVNLASCCVDIQVVCWESIKIIDFSVICGFRNNIEQQKLFEQGDSEAPAGKSMHNFYRSLAVDLAPWPIDWDDIKRFIFLAGIIKGIAFQKGINLRWGGDWNNDNLLNEKFKDWGHFEVIKNNTQTVDVLP